MGFLPEPDIPLHHSKMQLLFLYLPETDIPGSLVSGAPGPFDLRFEWPRQGLFRAVEVLEIF